MELTRRELLGIGIAVAVLYGIEGSSKASAAEPESGIPYQKTMAPGTSTSAATRVAIIILLFLTTAIDVLQFSGNS